MRTRMTPIASTITLCAVAATAVWAQSPIAKGSSVTATATIQAIDSTSRTVTLRDDKGQEDVYVVGPDVTRFSELKVGNTVKMTYYESVVLQIRKPGDKAPAASVETAVSKGTGALPSGTMAVQDKMTVTVKAIDPAVPSVTVTTPTGRTVTRKIENKKNIEGLKVGDQIDITYTQALVVAIERAK
jgi:Cu/Ag efflux protein CusF